MKNNIGIVWLRNDFRLLRNDALTYATQNHNYVCAFYILKKKNFCQKVSPALVALPIA
jgi:deoxyribodipyrimidine photo-lyase